MPWGCCVGLGTSGRRGYGAVDATNRDKHLVRNQGVYFLTLPVSHVRLTPEK